MEIYGYCIIPEVLIYHFLSNDSSLIIHVLIVHRHIKSAIWKFQTGKVKHNIIDYFDGHGLQIQTT